MQTADTQTLSAAQLISELRRLTHLNASELAQVIGVVPSTVSRIEQGLVCPSYDDMNAYVYRAGFQVAGGRVERADHLRGYFSAAEIGDVINRELTGGLNAEKLRVLLRTVPKLVYDWRELPRDDVVKMMLPRPCVVQAPWQALLEGIVQFFAHSELSEDAPAWTHKTKLKRLFVPRAAVHDISAQRARRLQCRLAPEFAIKNILFTHDEMQLI